ncbi:MAG: tetratricopeptide repeat protein [Bacteroidales bacterium]|nr:tetratricopeptide repeat protein [Bacteroidales bacterium]
MKRFFSGVTSWIIGSILLGHAQFAVSSPKITAIMTQDTLSAEQQRKFDYFYLEALRLKGERKYSAAFDMIFHCQTINPRAPEVQYELGQYYLTLQKNPQSLSAFKAAVNTAPQNYWYNQALASLYMQQEDSIKATETFELMTKRFPNRRDPLLSLLDLYTQQSNYHKIIQTLDRLESVMGKNEQISMEKFKVYVQMNDNKQALNEIESLTKKYPQDNRYQVLLADAYMQNNKKVEAHNIYDKVLAADPDNSMALYSLANYYKVSGQKDKYENQLSLFVLNTKVASEAKIDVMKELISQYENDGKDSIKVIGLFDKIIKEDSEDVQIPMLYANYLIAKGMNTQALPVLEHIVALDPSNVAARLMLLNNAIKKEDYKAVIRICEPGIEATPDALELYFYLAIAYNQAGRTDDAITTSKKALRHVTSDSKKEVISDFYALMGDVYYSKLSKKEAYAAYDSALVYNAENISALNNYAYYLSEEHAQLDKAEEMSYKTVKAEPNNSTFLDTYAWILFIKGKYTQALIYIDNAMKNGGTTSNVVTEHCGDIHALTGDIENALKYWQKALSMGSKSKNLKQKIAKKKYISE